LKEGSKVHYGLIGTWVAEVTLVDFAHPLALNASEDTRNWNLNWLILQSVLSMELHSEDLN
jgi:hypothetical protein